MFPSCAEESLSLLTRNTCSTSTVRRQSAAPPATPSSDLGLTLRFGPGLPGGRRGVVPSRVSASQLDLELLGEGLPSPGPDVPPLRRGVVFHCLPWTLLGH
jgi:hypothetical protein